LKGIDTKVGIWYYYDKGSKRRILNYYFVVVGGLEVRIGVVIRLTAENAAEIP